MRVLVTGACGNIGAATLRELLAAGHTARGFDLESRRARRVAREFGAGLETVWGDITDPLLVERAVEGCDAVVHDAAILPPASEKNPEATRRVNVEGTRHVVQACLRSRPRPRLVFASSVTCHGPAAGREPPVHADDPLVGTDHYSHSKIAAEELVRGSELDWVVLRFAATPPEAPGSDVEVDWVQLFAPDPESRLEYLHPADAGLAQTRAVDEPLASRRVFLIGGGPRCQVRLGDMNDAFFEAMGLGPLPHSAFGREPYYTDWMDTEESQRVLAYQRHDFEAFRRAMRARMRWVRPVVTALRPALRWWLLRQSPQRG